MRIWWPRPSHPRILDSVRSGALQTWSMDDGGAKAMGSKAWIGDPGKRDQVPEHLFTDNDPQQLRKWDSRTRKLLYEQSSWQLNLDVHTKLLTVRAMWKSGYHLHQTNGMRQALSIFDEWLEKKAVQRSSWVETSNSFRRNGNNEFFLWKVCNKHAIRYCSLGRISHPAKRDKQDATKQLKDAAHKVQRPTTVSLLVSVPHSSVFLGCPGSTAMATTPACRLRLDSCRYRCVCSYRGIHEVQVVNNARILGSW